MRFNQFFLALGLLAFAATASNGSSIVSQGKVPGDIFMTGRGSCPPGSIPADGANLLRTGGTSCGGGSCAKLFAAIGTAWGTADGTHFNAPDLRGLAPRGIDGTAGRDPDAAGRTSITTGGNTGNAVGSYQADEFRSHSHSIQRYSAGDNGGLLGGNIAAPLGGTQQSNSTGGNETRMKNVYVLYCVQF